MQCLQHPQPKELPAASPVPASIHASFKMLNASAGLLSCLRELNLWISISRGQAKVGAESNLLLPVETVVFNGQALNGWLRPYMHF